MIPEFIAERISQSAEFIVNKNIEELFPLFGPIEEIKWAHGWDPVIVYSENGKIEEGFIFSTTGHAYDENLYTWMISKYQPESHLVQYTVFTSNRVWTIKVVCYKISETSTRTNVEYAYTGLNETGNRLNKDALQRMFRYNLRDWQKSLEYYFETGAALEHYKE